MRQWILSGHKDFKRESSSHKTSIWIRKKKAKERCRLVIRRAHMNERHASVHYVPSIMTRYQKLLNLASHSSAFGTAQSHNTYRAFLPINSHLLSVTHSVYANSPRQYWTLHSSPHA